MHCGYQGLTPFTISNNRAAYGTITTINGLCRVIQFCASTYNRCFAYCRTVDVCSRLDTAGFVASLRRCAARMSCRLTRQVCAGYPFAFQLLLLSVNQLAPRQLVGSVPCTTDFEHLTELPMFGAKTWNTLSCTGWQIHQAHLRHLKAVQNIPTSGASSCLTVCKSVSLVHPLLLQALYWSHDCSLSCSPPLTVMHAFKVLYVLILPPFDNTALQLGSS